MLCPPRRPQFGFERSRQSGIELRPSWIERNQSLDWIRRHVDHVPTLSNDQRTPSGDLSRKGSACGGSCSDGVEDWVMTLQPQLNLLVRE